MSIVIQNRLSNLPKELQDIIYEYARDDSKKKEMVRNFPFIYRCLSNYRQHMVDEDRYYCFRTKRITPSENSLVIKTKKDIYSYCRYPTNESFITHFEKNMDFEDHLEDGWSEGMTETEKFRWIIDAMEEGYINQAYGELVNFEGDDSAILLETEHIFTPLTAAELELSAYIVANTRAVIHRFN